MKSVLIAHSDPEVSKLIEAALLAKGIGSSQTADGHMVLEMMEKMPVTAVVLSETLPGLSGAEMLTIIGQRWPQVRVVYLAPDDSTRSAVEAMRQGAFDYLSEPLDPNHLSEVMDRLTADDPLLARHDQLVLRPNRFDHIIGQSAAIQRVFRLIDKVAGSDSTVMIYGESGTGKELIARAIHDNSRRQDRPLVPVNCGAIPEELLESELFGHEKGAFTSAIRTRIGRFEMSNGGTIFLDEIGDMSPKLQVKVLRVLQEHCFERIGGAKTIDVDIRVITATNRDLRRAMEENAFREDLYYRLNVIPINVPPLRERREDVPLLVRHFLERFQHRSEAQVRDLSPEALNQLMAYDWPGNIRELENIIERMVILAEEDTLSTDDLPPRIQQAEPAPVAREPEITDKGIDFNQVVSDFEDRLLLQALEKSGWVKNKAAQLLNLNRTTLVEKLKKKQITPPSA
jgi:DNA-binding NtrC family response regulator